MSITAGFGGHVAFLSVELNVAAMVEVAVGPAGGGVVAVAPAHDNEEIPAEPVS